MSDDACESETCGSGTCESGSCGGSSEMMMRDLKVKATLGRIGKKIAVISGKGGVGKTTVSVNMALSLAMAGKKVGLMDVDITGPNVPKMLAVEGERLGAADNKILPVQVADNLKVVSMAFLLEGPSTPVIWRGPMKMTVIKQFLSDITWGDLDYLIMDLPPGTGDEALSVAQEMKGAVSSVVVTTPQDVALLDSRKAINFSKQLNMPVIGIVENMSGFSCPHCLAEIDMFKMGGGEKAAKEMGVPFLGRIPMESLIVKSGDDGSPFVKKYPESASALAFENIVANLPE